ncbi:MAG: GTPase HflX [Defluviitaleaceae bacterium]|nr:GTPase HflX [Defluviitaleaceae bacterium]MCL2263922.1 GTPase HflX [Defluviitaleaceae bacterium]
MQKVHGNTNGIRRSYIERLETIYETEPQRKEFCSQEIYAALAFFTEATGREAMVYIERSGRVETVIVGEQDRVSLPALRKRRSENRLSGLRCIHTHPGGNPFLSQVDIQSLKSLKLDAMASIGVAEGKPTLMQVGILNEITDDEEITVNLFGPYDTNDVPEDFIWDEITAADIRIRPPESKKSEAEIARAILTGIDGKSTLDELQQLADTAGFITVGQIIQPRSRPDRTYYLGYGKLHDLVLELQKLHADTVIFDDELTPSQIRNIQKELGKKIDIIDRTALILDIFSGRASTHEGRLQVELAQTKYLLPRMTGFWGHFHKMAGGGGGGGGARRGEGETQLEVDRRLLRKRLTELEREIDKVKSRREVQRAARERAKIPIVALVGYTNAGKSTLLNTLSGSDVLAEDKLFATLDPKSRRVNYGDGEFILVDTVGFINKLPHDLVNAFRATLEEARFADLLLHVVDISSETRDKQMEVVNDVLTQLEAHTNPTLTVYNKCDALPNSNDFAGGNETVLISAKKGIGIDALKTAITKKLSDTRTEISILLPSNSGAIVSRLYATGQVHSCEYREDGIFINATVTAEEASRLMG